MNKERIKTTQEQFLQKLLKETPSKKELMDIPGEHFSNLIPSHAVSICAVLINNKKKRLAEDFFDVCTKKHVFFNDKIYFVKYCLFNKKNKPYPTEKECLGISV